MILGEIVKIPDIQHQVLAILASRTNRKSEREEENCHIEKKRDAMFLMMRNIRVKGTESFSKKVKKDQ